MPKVITNSLKLSEDRRTVRVEIVWDGHAHWDDLSAAEVDLFLDSLREMREAMVSD